MTLKSPYAWLSRKLALFSTVKYLTKISVLNLRKYLTIKIDCNSRPRSTSWRWSRWELLDIQQTDVNTSSVSDMLDHLQWESLESRRTKAQFTMMYKIGNDLVDVPAEQYLTPGSSRTRATQTRKFRQISAKTTYYKNSFFPFTPLPHPVYP